MSAADQRILMSSPDMSDLERAALDQAILSGWVAPLGPEVDAFEDEVAAWVGRKYAVALSSGTAALHLGLLALGVGPGDVVVTATMTFAATANAIVYTGATPFFVDSDRDGNLDPQLLEQALKQLAEEGQNVGAVVPVDLLGKVADYQQIIEIADRFGVPVLVDAAESFGATFQGEPAGSFGQAAILSFNGNKIMTTSGGGMYLTDDAQAAEKVRYLATQARQPVVHYEHTDIGYNYRLSNLLAAVGRAQLTRLEDMLSKRKANREMYEEIFANVPGTALFQPQGESNSVDNHWLTAVLVDPSEAGFSAEDLFEVLTENNIESRPLWKPMHLQPVFANYPSLTNGTSEELFKTGLTLPSGSALTQQEKERIRQVIGDFVGEQVTA